MISMLVTECSHAYLLSACVYDISLDVACSVVAIYIVPLTPNCWVTWPIFVSISP